MSEERKENSGVTEPVEGLNALLGGALSGVLESLARLFESANPPQDIGGDQAVRGVLAPEDQGGEPRPRGDGEQGSGGVADAEGAAGERPVQPRREAE